MRGQGRTGHRVGRAGLDVVARPVPPPRLFAAHVAAIVAAQLFDLATFLIMVSRHGVGTELNPLVAGGFAGYGIPMVVLMKGVLVLLLASIVAVLRRPREQRTVAAAIATAIPVLAAVAGLIGGISNTIAR